MKTCPLSIYYRDCNSNSNWFEILIDFDPVGIYNTEVAKRPIYLTGRIDLKLIDLD